MGAITRPFAPVGQATINFTATTSSANTTITSNNQFAGTYRIYNSGSNDVFLEFGGPQNTATTTASMPLKAGTAERFANNKQTHVAAITLTSSSQIWITPGEGI